MRSRLPGLDSATTVGVLTAGGVYLIFNNAMPSIADVRTAPEHDVDVETARKHAAIMSAVLIGAVFIISRDVNSYIISGAALVGIDFMYKHANAINPGTGQVNVPDARDISASDSNVHPMPTYEADAG